MCVHHKIMCAFAHRILPHTYTHVYSCLDLLAQCNGVLSTDFVYYADLLWEDCGGFIIFDSLANCIVSVVMFKHMYTVR